MSFTATPKSDYETERDNNVARNKRMMNDLGLTKQLGPTTTKPASTKKVVKSGTAAAVPTVPAIVRPSNGEAAATNNPMSDIFGASRLVELRFPMTEPDGGFKLVAFVDRFDNDAIRAVKFVLRSVQQNLCPDLPEWKFKKQCSKKNSAINAYFGSQLTSATKEQMVELKAKCSAICGDRTVTLNLAPLSATMEFLSSNGKERHAMCIEANLAVALESTLNVANSSKQDDSTSTTSRSVVGKPDRKDYFYGLTSEQISPKLANDIELAKVWWIKPVESQRNGSKALKEASWGVKEARCKLFLGWALREHNIEPSLELFEKVPLVEAHTDWLRARAGERASIKETQVRVGSATIETFSTSVTFLKWLNRHHGNKGRKWKNIDAIEQFRELEQQSITYRRDNEVQIILFL